MFSGLDVGIVTVLLAVMIVAALWVKRYTRSVADFLAANRCAGRYLIGISEGIAGLGAITVVAFFEGAYQAGFTFSWWYLSNLVVPLAIALSGWVVYRYRQTRALTLAQFFEIRYSRRFRIFTGILAFISGIINFGIFPAVGARFFIYFCDLPHRFSLAGVELSTFPVVMIGILATSLFFVFMGGQIAVIVTDFIQGTFFNITFTAIALYLVFSFDWSQIAQALALAPDNASMVHPYQTNQARDFNIWYFLVGLFGLFYTNMAWQGTQAYNASGLNPHEARFGKILGAWRGQTQILLILLVPLFAYTVMMHPTYASQAQGIREALDAIGSKTIRSQMTVPMVLHQILPMGVMGAMAASMLAACISTHETYLHSWGTIFIQDVVLPFRKRPLSSKAHLRLLNGAIFGVAVFVFAFSLLFEQNDFILMFFAITGAIFLGGAGSAIVGGLYWRRGTAQAAWASMITGSVIATAGIALGQFWPHWHGGTKFPINGAYMMFIAMVCSIVVYVLVSLLGKRSDYDMDKLLHRGRYALAVDQAEQELEPVRGWRAMIGITPEFNLRDRIVYGLIVGWSVLIALIFTGGTILNFVFGFSAQDWMVYWRYYIWVPIVLGAVTTVWFTIGGCIDMKRMFVHLSQSSRDTHDDGTVVGDVNENALAPEECEVSAALDGLVADLGADQ